MSNEHVIQRFSFYGLWFITAETYKAAVFCGQLKSQKPFINKTRISKGKKS